MKDYEYSQLPFISRTIKNYTDCSREDRELGVMTYIIIEEDIVCNILHEDLNMETICAKMISRVFNRAKVPHNEICTNMLQELDAYHYYSYYEMGYEI